VVFSALILAVGPASSFAEARTIARISSVYGAVRVERDGQKLVATKGMSLKLHDKIVTGPGGSVNIVFADGGVLHLDRSGSLAISESGRSKGCCRRN